MNKISTFRVYNDERMISKTVNVNWSSVFSYTKKEVKDFE